MKRLILGLAGAAMLAGAAPAMAQPYGYDRDYNNGYYNYHGDRDYRDHHDRYDRDRRDRDWRYHRRAYSQVCSWRFGARVCWNQRY